MESVCVGVSWSESSKTASATMGWEPGVLPKYATAGSSGFDLTADLSSLAIKEQSALSEIGLKVNNIPASAVSIVLLPGQIKLIPTGIIFIIPCGYEIQLRPRSGLAYNNGITLANCIGTIDSDYKLEVGVLLINHGDKDFTVTHGMRIAQAVLAPVTRAKFIENPIIDGDKNFTREITKSQDETRTGGFGSTGLF